MRRLGAVGYLSFRRSAGRLVLTAIGIALGVAVVFGVIITNDTTTREVNRRVGVLTQPTILVQATGVDVPAERIIAVSKLPDVSNTDAQLQYHVVSPRSPKMQLYVSGYQRLLGPAYTKPPKSAAPWRYTGGDVKADDQIGMNGALADFLHARIGRPVDVPTPTGTHRFTLVQIGRRTDGQREDGDWAYTTVATARNVLGKGDVFTWVQLSLRTGVEERDWIARNRDALDGLHAVPSEDAAWKQQLREAARFGQASFTGAAVVAMFVGGFLIFLTLSTAVVERTRMYATFRALGASRRQVRRVVLTEALILGVVSSLAGLAGGLGAGSGLVKLTAGVYDIPAPTVHVPRFAPIVAFLVGVIVTVIGAAIPARRAARMQPMAAIRGSEDEPARLARSWIAGVVLFVAGVAGTLGGRVVVRLDGPLQALMWLPALLLLAGAVLLVPLVMRPVARAVGAITGRGTRGVGDVAVMHLTKERSRSAYTLALVMIVLAMVFSIRAGQTSWETTAERTMHHIFPADVGIYAGQKLTADELAAVRATHGVAAATGIRWGETTLPSMGGTIANLVIFEPSEWFAMQGFVWAEGNDRDARRALERGGSVLVPEGFADAHRLGVGSRVWLDTSHGVQRFRVAGTYQGLDNLNRPRLFVAMDDGRKFFGTRDADAAAVRIASSASADRVSADLKHVFKDRGDVTVFTSAQKGLELLRRFQGFVRIVYAVVLVAAIIGLLGMANTIAMSIYRRTREIGVLRAVGTRRRQVRGMVVVESATLAAVALVLAIPLGWVVSVSIIQAAAAATGGVFHYTFAWDTVPILGAVAAAIAMLAAAAPARRAARLDPVTSLRFE